VEPSGAIQLRQQQSIAGRSTFENAPGWEWILPPSKKLKVSAEGLRILAGNGVVVLCDQDKDGAFVVYLAYSEADFKYRAVAFDGNQKRYLLGGKASGSSGEWV